MNHKNVILPLISVLFLTFASCGQKYFTSDGVTWGTSYHIVYESSRNLNVEIDSVLKAVDAELSMFSPTSTVTAINNNTDSVAGADFAAVFNMAKYVSRLSGGVYDPTVGPLTDLWGFGRNQISTTPSDSAIARALESVGISRCYISDKGIVVKASPETTFDFSSIAKGYGVDVVANMLRRRGVRNYMVEIGGEIAAEGLNPRGAPWRIQIDAPVVDCAHNGLTVIELGPQRRAIASSGNYRNYRTDSDGTRYGHTLSPVTGRPVQGTVLGASIMATDCALADALATACMAAAVPDSALNIALRAGVDALLVVQQADTAAVITTPNWNIKF